MQQEVKQCELHPMNVKKDLARTITAGFHDKAAAEQAAQGWATQFQQRGVAEDVPEITISLGTDGLVAEGNGIKLPKLLVLAGLAASAGEAQRKLKENAVSVNGEKTNALIVARENLGERPTLRLGKRAVRILWAE
jgi:tyrosyl-tRNA synthetase